MMNKNNKKEILLQLQEKANSIENSKLRLKDWEKTILWNIDDEEFYWKVNNGNIIFVDNGKHDIKFICSTSNLLKIASGKLPFFIALWATGELRFEGSFSDTFKLGYIFLNDKRSHKVISIAHCFLNTNARFPGSCAFPGSTVPLIETLLQSGVGIIQMPCPEMQVLGLEKILYGEIQESELRQKFRNLAKTVVEQIKEYQKYEYKILGIIGMNSSPSCGVEFSKAKGTMLGIDSDLSEKETSGVFIEKLKILLNKENLNNVPVFGFRRILPGESEIENRLKELKNTLKL